MKALEHQGIVYESYFDYGITQEELKRLFNYDPETGVVTRKITVHNNAKAGDEVNCVKICSRGKKYIIVSINRRRYHLHRIIWLYVHGKLPDDQIDHINGNGLDNRLVNLRETSHKDNCRNHRRISTNTSGVTGVYFNKGSQKWEARIKISYKLIFLGHYTTLEEAVKIRKAAEIKHGFHENHGQDRSL